MTDWSHSTDLSCLLMSELDGLEDNISKVIAKHVDEACDSLPIDRQGESQDSAVLSAAVYGDLQKAQEQIRQLLAENYQLKSQLDLAKEEVLRLQTVVTANQSAERIVEKIVRVEIPVEKMVRVEVPVDRFVQVSEATIVEVEESAGNDMIPEAPEAENGEIKQRKRNTGLMKVQISDIQEDESWQTRNDDKQAAKGKISSEARRKVEYFLKRQDESYVSKYFNLHKEESERGKLFIPKRKVKAALEDIGLSVEKDDIEALFQILDIDGDGILDWSEFKIAASRSSKLLKELERWTASMPFHQLVAVALLPIIEAASDKKDPLRLICNCEDLSLVFDTMTDGCKQLFLKFLNQLKDSYAALDKKKLNVGSEDDGSKFAINTMSCGEISAFYDGLGGRVVQTLSISHGVCINSKYSKHNYGVLSRIVSAGFPDLNFMEAMASEHRSKTRFITPNYGIETFPAEEWRVVTEIDTNKEKEDLKGHKRVIPNYKELHRSERSLQARLSEEEIIAIILYTGPMYVVYNMVLRQWPKDKFKALDGNMYSTTIHCLVSGVTKISRVTKMPEGLMLYRGFGGLKLPEQFYKAPQSGYKGFVEWGFISTTSDKAIAIQYTGIAKGRAFPTVLQVRPAAVDHGADISEFSQFPGEREYLWNPCSLLEAGGEPFLEVTSYGIVNVIPVRMNNNVKTMTIEELRGQKKQMHLSSFEFLMHEVKVELAKVAAECAATEKSSSGGSLGILQWIIEGIVEGCRETIRKHKSIPDNEFIKDETFRMLVIEMLETKSQALSKVQLCREALKQQGGDDSTPIMIAAEKGNTSRVIELIEQKGDVAAKNKSMRTALHFAAEEGNVDIMNVLLNHGANVFEEDSLKRTPLHAAVMAGNLDAVNILLDRKALVNAKDSRLCTPLHIAAQNNFADVVKTLFKSSADLNAEDIDGNSALSLASHHRCVLTLRSLGADGWTPLFFAVGRGGDSVQKYFMYKDLLDCVQMQKPFPAWFEEYVLSNISLKNDDWTWGQYETSSMSVRSQDKLKVTKINDDPDYSCAIGSRPFDADVHSWEIRVDSVKSMWLGIARGVAAQGGLCCSPRSGCNECLIAFGSSGEVIFNGKKPTIYTTGSFNFSSGQVIEFELDTNNQKLVFSIDGKLMASVTNVDVTGGVWPYVCMDYAESATILSRKMRSGPSEKKHTEHEVLAFDNTKWTEEMNEILSNIPHAERVINHEEEADELVSSHLKKTSDILVNHSLQSAVIRMNVFASIAQLVRKELFVEEKLTIGTMKSLVFSENQISANIKGQQSILHVAAENGYQDAVMILLDARADLNARDGKGKSPLDCARENKVANALMSIGADGWTPLMMASEEGYSKLGQYLKCRHVVQCLRDRKQYPTWFTDLVKAGLDYNYLDWTWGSHESSSMSITGDRLTVKKSADHPDYSCVLGSVPFQQGIYRWVVTVANVRLMWIGIARGVEENNGLDFPAGSNGNESMLAFKSNGEPPAVNGQSPTFDGPSSFQFASGQAIEFELNMYKHTLTVKVDGTLVVNARDVDGKNMFPYVCMDYEEESATLTFASVSMACDSDRSISSDCILMGLDNQQWSSTQDQLLHGLHVSGAVIGYDQEKLQFLESAIGERANEIFGGVRPIGAIATRLNVLRSIDCLVKILSRPSFTNSYRYPMNRGSSLDSWYCGRDLGQGAIPYSDGRCGPTNGPQCASCKWTQNNLWEAVNFFENKVAHPLLLSSVHDNLLRSMRDESDLDSRNKDGCSALHMAAMKCHYESVLALIDAKADINVVNNDDQSPLDSSGDGRCSELLKLAGADGWTYLMVAAEKGEAKVHEYFKYREIVLCIHNKTAFPTWFEECVQANLRLQETKWTWGEYERSGISMSDDKLTVKKAWGYPDYSCAVGSQIMEKGIFIWAVEVENVQSMWIGITSALQESDLGRDPSSITCDYMLAFHNNSCPIISGKSPNFQRPKHRPTNQDGLEKLQEDDDEQGTPSVSFTSGQRIEFELDMDNHNLKVKVDGICLLEALDIYEAGIVPFVCMDYQESVTLVSRYIVSVKDNTSTAISPEERSQGFNNQIWDKTADASIHSLLQEDKVFDFDREGLLQLETLLRDTCNDVLKAKSVGAIATRLNILASVNHLMPCIKNKINMERLQAEILDGKDVSSRTRRNRTVLHALAEYGHSMYIRSLVEARADVDSIDSAGKSPLDVATTKQCREVLKSMGANGWSQFMIFAECGNHLAVTDLLHQKVDVNQTNKHHFTVLHAAAKGGHVDVLMSLIQAKANINAVDRDGISVCDIADCEVFVRSIHPHVLSRTEVSRARCNICNTTANSDVFLNCGKCNIGVCQLCAAKEGKGCRRVLQRMGADGWTPFLMALHRGISMVQKYLDCRHVVRCVKNRSPFPQDFIDDFELNLSLKDQNWIWGQYEDSSMILGADRTLIQKTSSYPDYSGAMGKIVFDGGIHVWSLKVDNVISMWVGIAKGLNNDSLAQYPFHSDAEFMLAFHNSESPVIKGCQPKLDYKSSLNFTSGQILEFELNLTKKSLTLRIDGELVCIVLELDVQGVAPYVCMDYEELVTIVTCKSSVETSCVKLINADDRMQGFNNEFWADSLNEKLSQINPEVKSGCVIDYNHDNLQSLGAVNMVPGGLSDIENLPIGSVATRIQILAFINRKIDMLARDIGIMPDDVMTNLLQESDIHSKTKSGGTALHFAATQGNVKLLQQLISLKADVNAEDNKGNRPLQCATDNECILALKQQGADGWTELMMAASDGDLGKVKSQLAAGQANVVAANRDLRTALHFAAEKGHLGVVQELHMQVLLEAKADVAALDRDSRNALDVCEEGGPCAKALLAAHAVPTPNPPRRPGERVRLSISYLIWEGFGGALSPGEIGTLVRDDGSDRPYLVRSASGYETWYQRKSVVFVPNAPDAGAQPPG